MAATEKPALSSATSNLIEQVVAWDNMLKAWKSVRANHGAPGPDGITIDDFPDYFYKHWSTIRRQLLNGTYTPSASRRKAIPKKDGGERNLSIPNVMERLIQQAISQILTPLFDPNFSDSSYGYRPKRSASEQSNRYSARSAKAIVTASTWIYRNSSIDANTTGYSPE